MVIQVTGADSGVGEALALYCLEKGHKVGVGLHTFENESKWSNYKDNACVLKTDVCDEDGLRSAAEELHKKFGAVDVVITMAGLLADGDRKNDIVHTDISELRKMFEVNTIGVLTGFRAFYSVMKKGGLYVAITSGGGNFIQEDTLFPAYTVTKAAANKMTQTIKNTVTDVRICAVHPGRVNTRMGRTTAQIEVDESISGIYGIITSEEPLPFWFLNYDGSPLSI